MANVIVTDNQSINVGKGMSMLVNFGAMPQAAIDHCLYIGARNILMDSHASITADEYPNESARKDAAEAMIAKKYEALMRGEVRVQSTREGDPVRAEALRMATDQIKAIIKKAGRKVSDYDGKAIREKALARITPELLATARQRVEENKSVDVESLADLGL